MGIMHKLFKRRTSDFQNLIMDLTKSSNNHHDNNNKLCEECSEQKSEYAEEQDLVPKLATDDNQFTAEHIVQLCKFLAEKSKRNKTLQKHLAHHSPRKSKPNRTYQSQRESDSSCDMTVTSDRLRESRLCPVTENAEEDRNASTVTFSKKSILSNKLLTDSNVCEKAKRHHATDTARFFYSQDKREILLKIRHQIFERKRQKNLKLGLEVGQQMDVWRPW